MCVCQKPHWPHRPAWPSTISTGANTGSRLQLNIHPRGQLSGRKQTHLWWPGLCGGMTYAPTCQMSLARFDSPGRVAPLPVHYVLIRLIVLSECKCWLLFHGSTGRRFAQMRSKLMSQLFTVNYLSVITPQRICRASLPIFSQAFLFNLTSTSHLDAAHCDHSFLLPSCRELSALLYGNLMVIGEGMLLSNCQCLFKLSSQLDAAKRWLERLSFSHILSSVPLNVKKSTLQIWQV